MTHFGDPDGFYRLDPEAQVRILAHHRITTAPPKQKQKTGMSAAEAAKHYAKKQQIEAIKKRGG